MGLMRLFGFRRGQLFWAVVLFAGGFYAWPDLFEGLLLPVLAAVCYAVAYYLHFAYRLYVNRRVVGFDFGGVLVTGTPDLQRLKETPGMRKLLKELRENYVIVILSNNNELFRQGMESRFGFDSLFDEVIFSSQVGAKKPDDAIFVHMLRRFGISPSRVVFVDDTPENIATARKLGICGINFDSNKQGIEELRKAMRETGLRV
jgi:FMN phosphatase YigB (HAD superfamily)